MRYRLSRSLRRVGLILVALALLSLAAGPSIALATHEGHEPTTVSDGPWGGGEP